MKTIMKLKKADCPYESLPRETIQAIRNPVALAIWVYLMSKPTDWEVRGVDIEKHFGFGRDKRLKAIKELERLGLYVVVPIKGENGKFAGKQIRIYYDIDEKRNLKNRNAENKNFGESNPLHNTDLLHIPENKGGHPEGEANFDPPARGANSEGKQNQPPKSKKIEDMDLPEPIREWLEYRKEIKHAITSEKTIKKLVAEYNKDPDLFVKKMEQSILNGWRGLFDLKEDKKPKEDSEPFYANYD